MAGFEVIMYGRFWVITEGVTGTLVRVTGGSPRVAARSKWSRIEALLRNRTFRYAYIEARDRFVGGVRDAVFPAGTYWLRRFARALCAPFPSPA
jgi:hypothetical protein